MNQENVLAKAHFFKPKYFFFFEWKCVTPFLFGAVCGIWKTESADTRRDLDFLYETLLVSNITFFFI